MSHRVFRDLTLRGAIDGEIRTAQFEGREHLVVPVVALVGNQVIHASNAPAPEFVPAEEIARSFVEWNGRPVVSDHPIGPDGPVSANDPAICERECFGRIANPTFRNDRLVLEAWLDPEKAASVGEDAEGVLRRAKAGDPIEVSVGAYVTTVDEPGEIDGVKYAARWADIGSDHLAMLPEGVEGACSNEMGCGAPRVNRLHTLTASGIEMPEETANKEGTMADPKTKDGGSEPSRPPSFLARLRELLGVRSAITDSNLRGKLWDALHDTEPGFEGVVDVNQEESWVVYEVWREDRWSLFRQTFVLTEDESVALNDDPEPVRMESQYVTAEAPCDCADHNDCQCGPEQVAATTTQEPNMAKQLKERIAALIEHESTPFTEDDAEYLAGLSADRISELEEHAAQPAAEPEPAKPEPETDDDSDPEPKPEPEPVGAKKVEVDEETYREMRAALKERRERRASRRADLVESIRAATDAFTEAELNEESLEKLEKLATAFEADAPEPSYGTRPMPRSSDADVSALAAPRPYDKPREEVH